MSKAKQGKNTTEKFNVRACYRRDEETTKSVAGNNPWTGIQNKRDIEGHGD